MRYGSVCSGIEAATVAWHPIGWEPVFFSEIEKFPSAVLAHHYPHVPNLGDMTKFKEWPDAAIDLLVGGTPCQSFSVAGLRRGLDDPRGSLMLTYLAIADRYRPKWIVWENVPGVLSSNGGRDFGTFLGALGELGYGFAYRVLDAQYVRVDGYPEAVPQRRRRVFVVGYLGDWRRAAAVLFERESLCGNIAPSRKKGEEVAGTIGSRTNGGSGLGTDFELDGGLCVGRTLTAGASKRYDSETEDCIIECFQSRASSSNSMNPSLISSTLDKGKCEGIATFNGNRIRRITPIEGERLQGFKDNYTLVPYKGRTSADGPRYSAIGNSMAVNVMRWLGRRIEMVENVRF